MINRIKKPTFPPEHQLFLVYKFTVIKIVIEKIISNKIVYNNNT